MGVTIHYRLRLESQERVQRVVDVAAAFAESCGWPHQRIAERDASLPRSSNDEEWEYRGPTWGIVLFPDERCDPLRLEFGTDLRAQDFAKTQYAGVKAHHDIIALFRELTPHFDEVVIEDEGEYWDTSDSALLASNLEACDAMLRRALDSNPTARGPVRLPTGRWADLIV